MLMKTIFMSIKHDDKLQSMIQENMEVFESTTPSLAKCSQLKPVSKATADANNSGESEGSKVEVTLLNQPDGTKDEDGIITPKKTVTFATIGQKSNHTFAPVMSKNTNSWYYDERCYNKS